MLITKKQYFTGGQCYKEKSKFGYFNHLQTILEIDKLSICNRIVKSGNFEQMQSKSSGWVGGLKVV